MYFFKTIITASISHITGGRKMRLNFCFPILSQIKSCIRLAHFEQIRQAIWIIKSIAKVNLLKLSKYSLWQNTVMKNQYNQMKVPLVMRIVLTTAIAKSLQQLEWNRTIRLPYWTGGLTQKHIWQLPKSVMRIGSCTKPVVNISIFRLGWPAKQKTAIRLTSTTREHKRHFATSSTLVSGGLGAMVSFKCKCLPPVCLINLAIII